MELIRYFSFLYCFFDMRIMRTSYGIWNLESAEGFPAVKDVLRDIESYLKGADQPGSVCITGWQEFQTENDYRNFTGTKYIEFHEAGAQEREKMLQVK